MLQYNNYQFRPSTTRLDNFCGTNYGDPVTELFIGTGNYKIYKMPSFKFNFNSTRTEIGMHHYQLGTSSMILLVKGTGDEGSQKNKTLILTVIVQLGNH